MHVFKFRDMTLTLDENSGSLFEVDHLAGEIITLLNSCTLADARETLGKKYDAVVLESALSEVEDLIEQGMLFTSMPGEPEIADTAPQVKALCLHVAHDCNLRCKYCFAGTGDFGGSRGMMDLATGKAAIDFLISSSGTRRNLEVDFFGGEPLLNFPLVQELTAYGEEQARKHGKVMRFTLTTNGTLFTDEVTEFLNEKRMAAVLSLDGRREVNDRMRPFDEEQGSYDTVSQGHLEFVRSRGSTNYNVRGTYTALNLDFSEDVRHLYDLGFREISLEPVVGGLDAEYGLRAEHLEVLKQEYDKLAEFYLECQACGDGFRFFHFNLATYEGPCFAKRISGCGAGFDYVAVTPEGDLYPCHQFVGNEEFKIGDVKNGITHPQMSETFLRANLFRKPECMSCWAKFFCSGGCHANAYHQSGDFLIPDPISCELQKKRIECALGIQAVRLRDASR
jgi:uncharacterized protein